MRKTDVGESAFLMKVLQFDFMWILSVMELLCDDVKSQLLNFKLALICWLLCCYVRCFIYNFVS